MRKRLETGTPGSRLAIVVTTALITTIVVAGGVALATVGINSVGSPEIKNGSVRSVDLKDNGVRSNDIQNGTIISADIGNNSVRGVDIKDGTITGADLRDGSTIRATSASSPEISETIFSGGAADILTTTIRAPEPGLLVMSASVDASGATDDQYTCQIRVDGFIVTGSSRVSRVNWAGIGGGGSGSHTFNSQENCATDAVQVVGAGQHTVAFHVSGRNTAAFHSGTVWAIWVPFDGNGNVPTP